MADADSRISAILFGVRRSAIHTILFVAVGLAVIAARGSASGRSGAPRSSSASQQQSQQAPAAPQQPAPPKPSAGDESLPLSRPSAPQQNLAPVQPQQQQEPSHTGPTIVLDPAHGGADTGARGENGILEKDIVLAFARMAKSDLERQGYRVIMTRNDDSDPSYDDRAAVANAYRDAIFVSFHVSSTGKIGTARVYSYQFASPQDIDATGDAPHPATAGLIPWREAQRSHVDASRRFADLLQTQLAERFTASPSISLQYAVRGLRSVTSPAVAIEISSVAASDSNSLLAMGPQVSGAIVHSAVVFRATANGSSQP